MRWLKDRSLVPTVGMVALAIAGAATAQAQVPGVPVLQNAFANPGLAFAANFGGGGGQTFFGAAAGWGLGSGRFLVSGAAGVQRANEATRGAYGARASVNVWNSKGGALGAAGFVGFGGAPRTRDESNATTNPAVMNVPAGLSIGYRRSLGATRGISAYVSPMYRWTRGEANDVAVSGGNLAGAIGVDFAISQSFGVTAGADFGKGSGDDGTSSTFGFAVSFVPGR